jgi:hypothetical protein
MVASYCPLDSRADLGGSDVAAIASPDGPPKKKDPCDWCDGDR